jgi:hypothetical protein
MLQNRVVLRRIVLMFRSSLRPILYLIICLELGGGAFNANAQSTDAGTYSPPVQREDGWPVAAAGKVGFNEGYLASLTQLSLPL